MDLKELNILRNDIDTHWYYFSKARALTKILKGIPSKKILDVGSGSAFFSRYILQSTDVLEAWCIDTSYLVDSDETVFDKVIHFRRSISFFSGDLVLLMDVLEHVDDDIGLLKSYVDMAPTGTLFLISVPAFQFIWNQHDEFLGHKRRYTLSQIELIAKSSGLRIKKGMYYFGLVFPIAVISRLMNRWIYRDHKEVASQLVIHSHLLNTALKILCRFEFLFMLRNRLMGLSAFCLAEKL